MTVMNPLTIDQFADKYVALGKAAGIEKECKYRGLEVIVFNKINATKTLLIGGMSGYLELSLRVI